MDINLYTEVNKMVKSIIKEQNLAILKMAKVVSVSGSNITVLLAGYDTNITIPNKTNQTLATNDQVICIILNGDFSNIFVGWKV